MRVVILCSSPYSETSCAVAARLAQLGYIPVGALTLPSWDRAPLVRKLGQWGLRDSFHYAVAKLRPGKSAITKQIRNRYLANALRHEGGIFRNMREVAGTYRFPVVTCADQNSPAAIAQLKQWAPDVAIFTGGNILRDDVLNVPRRGMSSPEWSLLSGVPLGTTIHFMDSGIDTGPLLLRREFTAADPCDNLTDLRNRMIAEAIELIAEAVTGLDRGTISPVPQADRDSDNQFFIMHERLKMEAARCLKKIRPNPAAGRSEVGKSSG